MGLTDIEINKIHDILTDLLCSCMKYIPYEKQQVGEWCFEYSSVGLQNRDCRIGKLVRCIDAESGEFITETIGGKEIHWRNASITKIHDHLLRNK